MMTRPVLLSSWWTCCYALPQVVFSALERRRTIEAMKHVTVALPDDMAERIEEHVRSGEYASSDELVIESLRDHLSEPDVDEVPGLEDFIRTQVVPAVERADQDPARRRPLGGIVERFRQRRAAGSV